MVSYVDHPLRQTVNGELRNREVTAGHMGQGRFGEGARTCLYTLGLIQERGELVAEEEITEKNA